VARPPQERPLTDRLELGGAEDAAPAASSGGEPAAARNLAASEPRPADPAPADPAPAPGRRSSRQFQLAIGAIALLVGAALFLSGFSLGARTAATPGTPAAASELFAPFWDVYETITRSFVGEVDPEELVRGAIEGMIEALDDPFSAYMSPEDLQRQREAIGGEFSGVGAEVTTRSTTDDGEACATLGPTCRLVVVAPIAGSPAERAGLRPGDVVTGVDGRSVDGETLGEAITRIRGPAGTTVTLTIVRDGGPAFDLAIVRDRIVERQVEVRDLAEGAVAYVRLRGVSDNAAVQFESALRTLRERGVTSFVLDLRDNSGGYATAARSIISQFVAEGPVFWQRAADGSLVVTTAMAGGLATGNDVRVAVLVNEGTASAAEMIAGALQDTGRGTLVGTTTFGKGTIQQWMDLSPTAGGFRLSIAHWLTPQQRSIHEVGLTPDVLVPGDAGPREPGSTGDPFIDAALDVLQAAVAMPEVGGRAARPGR
jgi:carboxyl-terminal processing protease